jgi:hypothetical protein
MPGLKELKFDFNNNDFFSDLSLFTLSIASWKPKRFPLDDLYRISTA